MNPTESTLAIATDPSGTDLLDRIDATRLVELLATYYATQGFTVEHVGNQGPQLFSPRSAGLKLRRNDRILVLECRPASRHPVEGRDVERLCRAARAQQATGAILVTAGQFSPQARLLGEQHPELQLIDHQLLRRMLGAEALASLEATLATTPAARGTRPAEYRDPVPASADQGRPASPSLFSLGLLVVMLVLAWLTAR